MPVVELSVAEFAASQRKVDALNARAVRRGWTGRLTLSGERVTVRNEGRPLRFPSYAAGAEVVRVQAEITGAPACYAGWDFLAALDGLKSADGTTAWVVRCAPGVDAAAVDRELLRPGWCDHCCTVRPARRHLYAVRHRDSGQTKQLGSTCVKDFTGWDRQPVFLAETEVLAELEREVGGGEDAFTPRYVVAAAIAAVEAAGWVSRSLAADLGRPATADLVVDFLVGRGSAGEAARVLLEPRLPAAMAQAPMMVKAVVEGLAGDSDGYAANLVAVLSAEAVTVREVGLLASAPAAYRRLLSQADEDAGPAPSAVWLGEVDAKVEVEGVVRTAITVDGYSYGSTQRLVVVEGGTALAKMYTTAAWAYEVEAGDQVRIVGTVKAHDLWHDEQQTVLSRPKRTDGGNGS